MSKDTDKTTKSRSWKLSAETRRRQSISAKKRGNYGNGYKAGHIDYVPKKSRKKAGLKMRSKNHWNWKGGITSINRTVRELPEYKDWRTKVFERDNYTCVFCGTRSGNGKKVILNVDHIDMFVLILKRNNIETKDQALECKELWDINNGRTLCYECHKKTFVFVGNQFKQTFYFEN